MSSRRFLWRDGMEGGKETIKKSRGNSPFPQILACQQTLFLLQNTTFDSKNT